MKTKEFESNLRKNKTVKINTITKYPFVLCSIELDTGRVLASGLAVWEQIAKGRAIKAYMLKEENKSIPYDKKLLMGWKET